MGWDVEGNLMGDGADEEEGEVEEEADGEKERIDDD